MAKFTHEHHLHLYGCLTAKDVYVLGRERWQARRQNLQHYAKQHSVICGTVPPYHEFWSPQVGLEQLQRYYEINASVSFEQFQAKFDLLIALFPLRQDDMSIWQYVLTKHLQAGLRYVEYRFIYPFSLAAPHTYLQDVNALLAQYEAESGGNFQPRLALSLARPLAQAQAQYRALRAMLDAVPQNLQHITAIDLCGFEEDYPPALYRPLFAEILHDNHNRQHKLAILLHVGESFQTISLHSAIRRVLQAHTYGVHRLGHAIALGLDAQNLQGTAVQESRQERLAHLHWLLYEEGRELQEFGYHIAEHELKHEQAQLKDGKPPQVCHYDATTRAELTALQTAALHWAKANDMHIESCPTSNLRLGKVRELRFHPLHKFSQHELCVTLSSDDPGIFASDIEQEAYLCRTKLKIPASFMQQMLANQLPLRSERLCYSSQRRALRSGLSQRRALPLPPRLSR